MRQSLHSILAITSFSTWKGIVFHFPSPIWDTLLWLKQCANLTGQWQEIFSHRKDLHQIPAAFCKWELNLLPQRTQGQTTVALSTCVNKRKNSFSVAAWGWSVCREAVGSKWDTHSQLCCLSSVEWKPRRRTHAFSICNLEGSFPSFHIQEKVWKSPRPSTQVGEAGESALCSYKHGRRT